MSLADNTVTDLKISFTDFESGAKREEDTSRRYDLIPPEVLCILAEVFAEGAKKYGEHNWEKGLPVSSYINHIYGHLIGFIVGDKSEPHLEHLLCNVAMLATTMERNPEMFDLP